MKKKILVIGFFGLLTNQIDGQTTKTRNIYKLIRAKGKYCSINYFDTQSLKQNKFLIFTMFWMAAVCDKLIYVPAHNSLKFIFPFIYIICKFRNIDILHVAVGGWLADYLKNKKLHMFLLRRIKGIFVESAQLESALISQFKLKNVFFFPNFRIHSFEPSFDTKHLFNNEFKIVFMARISRMKGIDAIFRLADRIETEYGKEHNFTIDFYGPISPQDDAFFKKQIRKFNFVFYKGVLSPENVYFVLSEYDLSVLPTKYPGEGFPGTILDSYIAGVPVIVSNWRFLPEFVNHGKTGYVFNLDNEEDFFYYIDKLNNNRHMLRDMKLNAYKKSKIFSQESAWTTIQIFLAPMT